MAESIYDKQVQVDALKERIMGGSAGVQRVSFNGRTVEYRSMDDLIKAYDFALRDLAIAKGLIPRRKTKRINVIARSGL